MNAETRLSHHILSVAERAAIAEIEATTDILRLVTKLTRMRFAAIAKFSDNQWVTCSVYDPSNLGIEAESTFDLETTICSDFCINPEALFIPQISQSPRHALRPIVKRFDLESYAGLPIFLPDGRLFGALCILDSQCITCEDPDVREVLSIFAKLIGCIFFANLSLPQVPERA